MRGAGEGLRRIAPVRDHRVGGLGGAHALEQVGVGIAWQRRALLPSHLERARGLDRVPLALRDDADEVALAHDPRAGNGGNRALVDAQGLGAVTIGALPAWPHDAAVQHVGHAHLLHVDVSSGHLVRDIDARHARPHELVPVDRLLRRDAGELDVERLVAEQRAVAHGAAGMTVDRHHPFGHDEAAGLHAEPRRGQRQQRLPRLRGRRADLRAAAMNRRARGRRTLVGHGVGVEQNRFELAHLEIELFARDLQQAGGVALAELALAEIDRRGVVRMHGDPRIDRGRIRRTGGVAARGGGRQRGAGDAEADDERAALEQVATGQRAGRCIGEDGVHRVAPAIVVDATWIAFMMRG